MKCPKCGSEMKNLRKDVSNNTENGDKYKEYDRVQYNCEKDDVWIGVETPKE